MVERPCGPRKSLVHNISGALRSFTRYQRLVSRHGSGIARIVQSRLGWANSDEVLGKENSERGVQDTRRCSFQPCCVVHAESQASEGCHAPSTEPL